jgi:hypothetical protein
MKMKREATKPNPHPGDIFDVRAQCEAACLTAAENCEGTVENAMDDCRADFKTCVGECHRMDV